MHPERKNEVEILGEKIAGIASFMMTVVSLVFVLLFAASYLAGEDSGFLDLSNLVQYFLAGAAVFFGTIAWLFGRLGDHTKLRGIRNPRLRRRKLEHSSEERQTEQE